MIEGWFDIHNHIMPAVDDGSIDWDMSKKMLELAYSEGVRKMFVTPHYHAHYYRKSKEELVLKHQQLQEIAHAIDSGFDIYLGNELYYNHDACELLENQVVQTMNGSKYVLVEFRPSRDFSYIKNALYDLQVGGYQPILAHVERFQSVASDISRAQELVEMGVYLQTNASTVTGENGGTSKRFIRKLLKMEMIHFIGTDSHDMSKRSPRMKKCATYLLKKCDSDYAEDVLYNNAMKIVEDEYI